MEIIKLTDSILNNDLSKEQVVKILTDLKRDSFQFGYKRGYWTRDGDLKKIRRARNKRIKKEHENMELKQDK